MEVSQRDFPGSMIFVCPKIIARMCCIEVFLGSVFLGFTDERSMKLFLEAIRLYLLESFGSLPVVPLRIVWKSSICTSWKRLVIFQLYFQETSGSLPVVSLGNVWKSSSCTFWKRLEVFQLYLSLEVF